jgi:flagellar biosynthesis chaperone FliJ
MEDYDHLKTAISELEESIVWVKTLADVSKTTQEASKDLKDASHDSKKLALQSEAMLSELKDIRVNEEKLVSNSISAINQSKSQLEKATTKMVDAHVELRQQIMSDLSGIRQSLSVYHQDQLDKIKEETNAIKKSIQADFNSLTDIAKTQKDEIDVRIGNMSSRLEEVSQILTQHKEQQKRSRIKWGFVLLGYMTILFIVLYMK